MQNDKNKGLADNGEGEIIMNESGTSISTDEVDIDKELAEQHRQQTGSATEKQGLSQ